MMFFIVYSIQMLSKSTSSTTNSITNKNPCRLYSTYNSYFSIFKK